MKTIGDNLIAYPYYETTKTVNGITFTDNHDGSVTVNGTSTASNDLQFLFEHCWTYTESSQIPIDDTKSYLLTGAPAGSTWSVGCNLQAVRSRSTDSVHKYDADYGDGKVIEPEEGYDHIAFRIVVRPGKTVNNLTFTPRLLEIASGMDAYHVVGDPELAPPVPPTSVDASEVSYNSESVESALDKSFMNKSNPSTEPADMNNIVSIGTHTINPSVTTLNVPTSGRWAFVEVFRHGTSSLTQLWVDSANEYMYTRTRSGNPAVWSSWKNYEQLVTFYDLSKYGIAVSGEKINATLEEICKKVPLYCEVKIYWTGNDATRFGTLANQIPETYGSLYIHKTAGNNPCSIEFIAYASGSHYVRNYDYINSTNHLSDWVNLNTVGYAIASNEPTATSSRAYSVGQYMVRGGNLKKVTSAIASGESITGNNTSNTTVGAELTQINSNLSNIGTVYNFSTIETTNIPANTDTLVCKSGSMEFGTYLVIGYVTLATNSAGIVALRRNDYGYYVSQGYANTAYKPAITLSGVIKLSNSSHGIRLEVSSLYQNTVTKAVITAIRIK